MSAHSMLTSRGTQCYGQQVTKHENLFELPCAPDSTDPFFKFSSLFLPFRYLFVMFDFAESAAGSRFFQFGHFRSTFGLTCS